MKQKRRNVETSKRQDESEVRRVTLLFRLFDFSTLRHFDFFFRCSVAVMFSVSVAVAAPAVRAVHIDGTAVTGDWLGSANGQSVLLRTIDGPHTFFLNDLSSISFKDRSQSTVDGRESKTPVLFYLADGGQLFGRLLPTPQGADPLTTRETLLAKAALGDALELPFDRLAGIKLARRKDFPRADELFRTAIASRLPGRDVLVTRSADEARTLRGRLESLDDTGGTFVFGRRARTFNTEKIFGIVLAGGVAGKQPQIHQVTLRLVDGSVFSGKIERADDESVRVKTSLGLITELPLDDVASIHVHSDRIVYVSDLSPSGKRVEGLLHRPWPVRFDRGVSGGPLSIGGRTFARGLGVHSFTRLEFEIGGVYETLVATIGIDDSARPRGNVVFRVLGDSNVLFDSGEVTGVDPPRDIIVDVSGVAELTLIVDYGAELDLADAAVWGDARLLKPRTKVETDAS